MKPRNDKERKEKTTQKIKTTATEHWKRFETSKNARIQLKLRNDEEMKGISNESINHHGADWRNLGEQVCYPKNALRFPFGTRERERNPRA